MILGDHLTDGAARRVPDEMRRVDAEAIHQAQDVAGHLLHGVPNA